MRTPEQRQVIGACIVAALIVAASAGLAVYRNASRTPGRLAASPAGQVAGELTVLDQAGAGPQGPSTGPPRPSPGCAKAAAPLAEPQQRTLDVAGTTREYRLASPAGAPADQPLPLVLDMHGLGLNRDQQATMSGWDRIAAVQPLIAVQPQAVNGLWNITPDDANVDVAFLRALVTSVAAERCVDLGRVYADGISMGGIMASVLACKAPDLIAAVGLVSGAQWKPECAGAPPRPAVVFWGRSDCVLPFFGGLGPCLAVGPPGRVVPTAPLPEGQDMGFPPVERVVESWATHNGCRPAADEPMSQSVVHRRFRSCRDLAVVDLYIIDGGGHTWPGNEALHNVETNSPPSGRGVTTMEIDATATIWGFFQQFQLAG